MQGVVDRGDTLLGRMQNRLKQRQQKLDGAKQNRQYKLQNNYNKS